MIVTTNMWQKEIFPFTNLQINALDSFNEFKKLTHSVWTPESFCCTVYCLTAWLNLFRKPAILEKKWRRNHNKFLPDFNFFFMLLFRFSLGCEKEKREHWEWFYMTRVKDKNSPQSAVITFGPRDTWTSACLSLVSISFRFSCGRFI